MRKVQYRQTILTSAHTYQKFPISLTLTNGLNASTDSQHWLVFVVEANTDVVRASGCLFMAAKVYLLPSRH